MSEAEIEAAKATVSEPVTQKEFFSRAWQLGALMIVVGFGVWQLVGRDITRVEDDTKALKGQIGELSQKVERVDRAVFEIKSDLKAVDERLERMERTLEDIANARAAGNIGGPPGRPRR